MTSEIYCYFDMIKGHLGNLDKIFNGEMIYPRQMEIHLPGDGIISCNFNCYHCQARKLEKTLAKWEVDALQLIEKLEGKIPYVIMGGQYTEPLLNKHFVDFIRTIKESGASYGIHTNGSLLGNVIEELCKYSTSPHDFISCSLDAGSVESHMRTKNIKVNMFDDIMRNLEALIKCRGKKAFPTIRITYLMNRHNTDPMEIKNIVYNIKKLRPDTLRFSIPYFCYGDTSDAIEHYRDVVELKYQYKYFDLLTHFLSKGTEKPSIIWMSPYFQDIHRMSFNQCICGYFSIILGADGWIYKCSSSTAPNFKKCRLGRITANIEEFKILITKNQNPTWKPNDCFAQGARCNRIMLEINNKWKHHTKTGFVIPFYKG